MTKLSNRPAKVIMRVKSSMECSSISDNNYGMVTCKPDMDRKMLYGLSIIRQIFSF